MTGVKLGDRVIAIGANDAKLIAALAVKAGLTGHAVVVDADDAKLRATGSEIEREGGLVDLTHAAWTTTWPHADESFDVAVIRDVLAALDGVARASCLREVFRTLRPGGRAIVIEPAPRARLGGLVKRQAVDPEYAARGGAAAALKAQGFAGVRVLAERSALLFTEGAKRSSS